MLRGVSEQVLESFSMSVIKMKDDLGRMGELGLLICFENVIDYKREY